MAKNGWEQRDSGKPWDSRNSEETGVVVRKGLKGQMSLGWRRNLRKRKWKRAGWSLREIQGVRSCRIGRDTARTRTQRLLLCQGLELPGRHWA